MPERLQRRRTRGARLPAGTVCVDRSTGTLDQGGLGNPWPVGRPGPDGRVAQTRTQATAWCAAWLDAHPELLPSLRRRLQGRSVACWCALDDACHGDLLLAAANE